MGHHRHSYTIAYLQRKVNITPQIFSKLATAWADATTTDNVVDGAVQWHQWGLMCEIIVAVSISTPEA